MVSYVRYVSVEHNWSALLRLWSLKKNLNFVFNLDVRRYCFSDMVWSNVDVALNQYVCHYVILSESHGSGSLQMYMCVLSSLPFLATISDRLLTDNVLCM